MTMIAGPSVWTKWDEAGGSDQKAEIRRVPILPGRSVRLPVYSIHSIEASHNFRIGDAMNYVIDDGNVTLLYASDSGLYADHTWDKLKGFQFDVVVMEGTIWKHPSGREHLNEGDFGIMLERLRSMGAVTDSTVTIATHFSHQGVDPHEELEAKVNKLGAQCAFDGLTIHVESEKKH
jgi:predicted metallo-beta-lactamase superfamily hydrolase